MNVPLRVPSSAGSASSAGAWNTTASGSKRSSSASPGVRNIVRAKRAWYATGVTTRSGIRDAGSAPANASTT